MDIGLFLQSLVIGLSVAAPVGPIGLLCIQRSLGQGAAVGFATGMGAAVADGIYGAVGAFGLTAVTRLFNELREPLAYIGAAFLLFLGVRLWLSKSNTQEQSDDRSMKALGGAFASTVILTLANPATILSFVAIFAVLGGNLALTADRASTMVLGVFLGSALWWLGLSFGVSAIRHRISQGVMLGINRASGTLIIGFAVWQIVHTLF